MMLDNLITRETDTTTGLCINCSVYTHKNVVYYYKTSIFVNNVCPRIKIILIRKSLLKKKWSLLCNNYQNKTKTTKQDGVPSHSGYMTSEFTFFPPKIRYKISFNHCHFQSYAC